MCILTGFDPNAYGSKGSRKTLSIPIPTLYKQIITRSRILPVLTELKWSHWVYQSPISARNSARVCVNGTREREHRAYSVIKIDKDRIGWLLGECAKVGECTRTPAALPVLAHSRPPVTILNWSPEAGETGPRA